MSFRAIRQYDELQKERDRYKLERGDLLAAMFQSYGIRERLIETILARGPDAKQLPESRQAGPSQSG